MAVAKPQVESRQKVLLYPGEDGYFVVEVPSLPGCISQGKTREEAFNNSFPNVDIGCDTCLSLTLPMLDRSLKTAKRKMADFW